ncbi:MAG: hypothetical protein WCY05_01195 [Candidatus Omnitrophota bacterium]
MTSDFIGEFKNEAIISSQGKSWLVRLPVLLWFLYVLSKYLTTPDYGCLLSALNLGIHEFGHLIFIFFGQFLHVLGGTLFQLFVPLFAVWSFYRQKDFFAISFALGWFSTNLFDVARYIADARAQELPLVTPFGDTVIHDWNYLLDKTGLLSYDIVFSGIVKFFAVIAMLVCLVYGSWILRQMAKPKL